MTGPSLPEPHLKEDSAAVSLQKRHQMLDGVGVYLDGHREAAAEALHRLEASITT